MKRVLGSIFNAVIWALIIILLFMVASGVYQNCISQDKNTGFFGIGYAVVVSGSMEPNIHVNDMIVYQAQKQEEYCVGQVIVYERTEESGEKILITHRIVDISGDVFITQGDANNAADVPFTYDRVVGKVVWRIPYAGVLVNLVKSPAGIGVLVGITVVILLGMLIAGAVKKRTLTVYGNAE